MSEYDAVKVASWLRRRLSRMTSRQATEMMRTALREAYSAGYSAGHEQQMQMRILDRQECEAKHGR